MSSNELLAHFIKRDRKKQGITKLPTWLTAVGLLLLLIFSLLIIYFLAKSLPLKTIVPIKDIHASMFQKNLSENCKKLEKEGYSGDTHVIDKSQVPFVLSDELSTINNGKENVYTCIGIDSNDKQSGYVTILLKDDFNSWFTVYDSYSGEYAHSHGSAPYIGTYGTVVKESDDVKITAYLEHDYGSLVKGSTRIFLRGEKTLELRNGEFIYASFSKEAIRDDDKRLSEMLMSYTSNPTQPEYTGNPDDPYEDEIISRFFGNVSYLESSERESLSQIERVLAGIAVR